MKRWVELLFNILTIAIAVGAAFLTAYLGFGYYNVGFVDVIIWILLGAVIAAVFNTVIHELGHVLFGRKNFKIISVRFFFFTFFKENGKIRCDVSLVFDSSGATETIPLNKKDLEKNYKKMTLGGLLGSALCFIVSVGLLFTYLFLPFWAYFMLAISLPISTYYLAVNAFPMTPDGSFNDGGVLYSLSKGTDSAKVMINVLKIQAEVYGGKTYGEVAEHLYFNLPQLPETDVNFAMLLSAKYNYYLDKGEYNKAHSMAERLSGLDYLLKENKEEINAMLLYDACTFKYDEKAADDLMESTEKFLNRKLSSTNLRIKCAYLLYVVKDVEKAKYFYEEGVKLADADDIKGVGRLERKLLDKMKKDM